MAPEFEMAGDSSDLDQGNAVERILLLREQATSIFDRIVEAYASATTPDVESLLESECREALELFSRSYLWSIGNQLESESHEILDRAGAWVRETFGCALHWDGSSYFQKCPVALAHSGYGFSMGGSARRICTLCGEDLSECPHLKGKAYLVPGGSAELGWCRVCRSAEACEHSPEQFYRVGVTAKLVDIHLEEISLVDRPANPEARLLSCSISNSTLLARLGDDFIPGIPISCDNCLTPCESG
jgi:hypothetical protein